MALPPIANLVAHYKCNDNAASTVVTDSTAHGYHMTASDNTEDIRTASGKISGALGNLYASTTSIIRQPATEINAYPFSVCGWFIQNGNPTSIRMFYQICDKDSPNSRTYLRMESGANTIQFITIDSDSQTTNVTNTYNDNVWHHYAVVYTSASDRKVYIDNGLIAALSQSTSITLSGDFDSWSLGYRVDSPGAYYRGWLDDLRIYDIALSTSQISAIYNSGNGTEDEGTSDAAYNVLFFSCNF